MRGNLEPFFLDVKFGKCWLLRSFVLLCSTVGFLSDNRSVVLLEKRVVLSLENKDKCVQTASDINVLHL